MSISGLEEIEFPHTIILVVTNEGDVVHNPYAVHQLICITWFSYELFFLGLSEYAAAVSNIIG